MFKPTESQKPPTDGRLPRWAHDLTAYLAEVTRARRLEPCVQWDTIEVSVIRRRRIR